MAFSSKVTKSLAVAVSLGALVAASGAQACEKGGAHNHAAVLDGQMKSYSAAVQNQALQEMSKAHKQAAIAPQTPAGSQAR